MADMEIVRESADGFTHQGHSVSYTDSYVKVRRSFRRHALKTLRGAPLSVWWEIALADEPPDVAQICDDTGIKSQTTVCAALDFLVEHGFIKEVGRAGRNGAKAYAPVSYTWSGSDRNAPPVEDGIPKNGIPKRAAKIGIPSQELESDGRENWNPTKNNDKRAAKIGIRRHDMNDDVLNKKHEEKSFIHGTAQTREILQRAGIEGKNLELLAASVAPEIAETWAQWLKQVDRRRWSRPEGYAFNTLSADPTKRAPYVKSKEKPAPRGGKNFSITGKLANRVNIEN